MAINISNILTQLNTKMTSDSSSTTTELLRRVQAYNSLNNIGVLQYKSYRDLPAVDSSNIGQLVYVSGSEDDSFGTFFFAKALYNDSGYYDAFDSTNSGWQKIVLNANDSDNFANVILAPPPWTFQGETSGYTIGGRNPANINVISKYSFVSDGNGTDVGDLTLARLAPSGQSSTTYGYASGGNPQTNVIDKHPFSADANATDVGDLTLPRAFVAGQSSETTGYASGGYPNPATPSGSDVIDKFPFSSDANATDVGNLTVGRQYTIGQSSRNYGYTSGGYDPSVALINTIDKFSYTTDGDATDVGDMTTTKAAQAGQNSDAYGYNSGGLPDNNIIEKFSFSSDGNATDVGDLTVARGQIGSGTSSTVSGYSAAGSGPNTGGNVIDKFPFATDANAADVGDTVVLIKYSGSNQV